MPHYILNDEVSIAEANGAGVAPGAAPGLNAQSTAALVEQRCLITELQRQIEQLQAQVRQLNSQRGEC